MDKPEAVKQRVVDAVDAVSRELSTDLERYRFELFPSDLEESCAGWHFPALC